MVRVVVDQHAADQGGAAVDPDALGADEMAHASGVDAVSADDLAAALAASKLPASRRCRLITRVGSL